jgi:hypothetical protein
MQWIPAMGEFHFDIPEMQMIFHSDAQVVLFEGISTYLAGWENPLIAPGKGNKGLNLSKGLLAV